MRTVFADTFYFLALLDSEEPRHRQAFQSSRDASLRLVTTEWVMVEFADAYSQPPDRADFVSLYCVLADHPLVKILPADTRLFQGAVDLFEQRQDKNWSLTDCLSFLVMQQEGITEALTGDKHFEQAGLIALLK